MNLETNIPNKGFINPLTKEGMRALAIVLGVLVVIAGVVYVANFGERKESTVLPVKTLGEEVTETPTVTPLPTPLTEEETLPASPSPTRKVLRPTGYQSVPVWIPTETPTPAIEGL